MSKIYYQGNIYSADQPVLTGLNSAFLYGQSVFTSSVIHEGKVLFFDDHLKRTLTGVGEIFDVSEEQKVILEQQIREATALLIKNSKEDDYFRLTFFWENELQFTLHLGGQGRPIEEVKAKTVIKLPRGEYIPEQVKIGNYVNELYLKKSVAKEGFNDVLYVYNNKLLEFSTGNIFLGNEKSLVTPRKVGIFSGIIRNKIITCSDKLGLKVEQRDVDIREIENFEFALICNSVKLIVPVLKIDDKTFQTNQKLVDELLSEIKSCGN